MALKLIVYKLKRLWHFFKTGLLQGLSAQLRYRFPERKLKILSITGTDGKTTSNTLLYHLLKSAGKKVGLLTTVAAYIGEEKIDTGFHVTAPQPKDLYKFMRRLVNEGYEYLILETTSHGLYQYRPWAIKPQVAGLTNITHEHLDYHLTYHEYLRAKAILFKHSKLSILNSDDDSYSALKKILKNKQTDFYHPKEKINRLILTAIKDRFAQAYNQLNARLVAKMALTQGLTPKQIADAIRTFPPIPGRMEFINSKRRFEIVVDFAHTPNGLKQALLSLKEQMKRQSKAGRLIALFGCAGLRDFSKRPLMGKFGSEIADLCIFTSEDPRTEDVWSIINQMKAGVEANHHKIISLADRKEAIKFALNKLAKPGDVVGFFGKGHEQSLCIGKV